MRGRERERAKERARERNEREGKRARERARERERGRERARERGRERARETETEERDVSKATACATKPAGAVRTMSLRLFKKRHPLSLLISFLHKISSFVSILGPVLVSLEGFDEAFCFIKAMEAASRSGNIYKNPR